MDAQDLKHAAMSMDYGFPEEIANVILLMVENIRQLENEILVLKNVIKTIPGSSTGLAIEEGKASNGK